MRLEGKVALISGGARGQGAAEARLFAQEGAAVVIGDILDEEGMRLEAEIRELGGNATYVHLDVTDADQWADAVTEAVNRYGKLDILVNNAGIGGTAIGGPNAPRIHEAPTEVWDQIMDVNGKGVFLGTRAAIPAMRTAGGGSIINISSIAGMIATRPGSGAGLGLCQFQGRRAPAHQVHRRPVRRREHPLQLGPSRVYRHRHDGTHHGRPGAASTPRRFHTHRTHRHRG